MNEQEFREAIRELLALSELAFTREEARQVLNAYTDGAEVPPGVIAEALRCSERLGENT